MTWEWRSGWLRSPVAFDTTLALLVAALQVTTLWFVPDGHPAAPDYLPDAPALLLALTGSLPLVGRRRHPTVVLAVVGLSAVAQAALGIPAQGFGLIVALYSAAVYAPPRESLSALGIFALFTGVSLVLADAVQYAAVNALVFITAWVLGDQRRANRARTAALADRTRQLEQERADHAQLATLAERTRLAAELQDVVAHGLSAMLAQARSAERLLERDPAGAVSALESVEDTGRQSLTELRRLLGLLRGAHAAELHPQPGLHDVDTLVGRFRAAGLDVRSSVEGVPRPLPAVAGLSVYRILQEAFAAALDGPEPGPVAVTVRFTADGVDVVVDAQVLEALPDGVLAGARQRVALLGGTLRTEPGEGSCRMVAQIPAGGLV